MKNLSCILFIFYFTFTSAQQWLPVGVSTNSNFKDIIFINALTGLVVGGGDSYGVPNGTDGVIYKTTDGGNTWSEVFTQAETSLNYIVNTGTEIVVFGNFSGNSYKFTSTDNGLTWQSTQLTYFVWDVKSVNNIIYFKEDYSASTLKKIENNIVTDVANNVGKFGIRDNELIYVDIAFNAIYKSTNYGNTFQLVEGYPTGFSQNQETNAVLRPFDNTLVVHYTYPPTTQYSTDNGDTWTLMNGTSENYCEIISENLLMGAFNNSLMIQENFQAWETQATLSDPINKIYIYSASLGFAIGNNGMIYKSTTITGLSTHQPFNKNEEIQILPNPSSDILSVKNNNTTITKIELYTTSGEKIKSYPTDIIQIDISNLKNGTYLIKIYTPSKIFSEKIIKK